MICQGRGGVRASAEDLFESRAGTFSKTALTEHVVNLKACGTTMHQQQMDELRAPEKQIRLVSVEFNSLNADGQGQKTPRALPA